MPYYLAPPNTAIFIATAAVADYKPSQQATQKIKKNTEFMQIELERTQDILAAVAALDHPPFTLWFCSRNAGSRTLCTR